MRTLMLFLPLVHAQSHFLTAGPKDVLPPPGQPTVKGQPGRFEVVGNSIVSAQQMFVGADDKVYILDKVENNAATVNGHPAWGSEWTLSNSNQRAMDVVSNSFCAGGNVLGNGTWVSIGGNQAVTTGGVAAANQDGSTAPYMDTDGRRSIRLLTPCDDNACQWVHSSLQVEERWYPTVETLEDGSVIILGGCKWGGFVNDASQSNPTYEFFPPRGPSITSPILQNTLPANLYPLVWLLPSGRLFIQANWASAILDYNAKSETPLDNIPDAVRTYPASGASVMLPLKAEDNWTATILFCGGSNVANDQWTRPDFRVVEQAASASCVRISPDASKSYVQDDTLPERRSMGNMILLPDGKILMVNGARQGTAGYGTNSWAVGQSYADDPVLLPSIYDPYAPPRSRWSSLSLGSSAIPRMYHSSATLLPDGSVLIAGSNPNPDFVESGRDGYKYSTEYRTERFYPPSYFGENKRRPQPKGLVGRLGYGGDPFDVVLDKDDLEGDVNKVSNASVVLIRPGYSTHSMNMGQRMIYLPYTYTGHASNNSAVLHVSQLPPNAAIFAPGPALIFVVVNGIPSIGKHVMIGSGKLEKQPMAAVGKAPASTIIRGEPGAGDKDKGRQDTRTGGGSGGGGRIEIGFAGVWVVVIVLLIQRLV